MIVITNLKVFIIMKIKRTDTKVEEKLNQEGKSQNLNFLHQVSTQEQMHAIWREVKKLIMQSLMIMEGRINRIYSQDFKSEGSPVLM